MLQNRVDPFGNIIKSSARGAWMGNRGIIHDERQNIVRPYKLKAWLICKLEFKGRKRQVMAPDRYTELFFLDEATAFAAGHRPCSECRRSDFDNFKSCWLKGNPEYGFDKKTSIQEIDKVIHSERIDKHKEKVTYEDDAANIPDGTFILLNGQPFMFAQKKVYKWSSAGYDEGIPLPQMRKLVILTPRSVVNAFRAGYIPQIPINIMM